MMDQPSTLIEALFFKCYYAYLKGNLKDTTLYYDLLREEYKTVGSPNVLNEHYLRELAHVKSALDGGSVSSKGWLSEPTMGIKFDAPDIPQKDLVKRIYSEGTNQLKVLLDAKDGFHLYNIEHSCDQYGFVDMYYRDKETAFPLEVKIGQGDHKLVGQIMKYDLSCRLHLHEKFYVRVQAVTICSSYDEHTLSELKRNSVIPILYRVGETLTLSQV